MTFVFWQAGASSTVKVKLAGQTIQAEVAATLEARAKGLSGRRVLKPGQGMLFVFDRADYYPFWMKEMRFPIDIVWIDNGQVVDFAAEAPPDHRPERPVYKPRAPASLVLELPAGFVQKYGLKMGDKAELPQGLTTRGHQHHQMIVLRNWLQVI